MTHLSCSDQSKSIVISVFMAISGLFVLPACDEPPAPPSSRTAAEAADPDDPRLKIENKTIDLGAVADYETRTAEVRFQNVGGDVLTIKQVIPTCGCTTIGFKNDQTFAPGEQGSFTLDFTPKSPGQQQKYIQVVSSDPLIPITTVTLKADVTPTLEAEPRFLAMGRQAFGQPHIASIEMSALADDCTLNDVSFTGDLTTDIMATITDTTPEGTRRSTWRVDVEFPGTTPWGWQNGSMVVSGAIETADGPRPIEMRFLVNGSFEGEVNADETLLPLLSLRAGQQILKTTTLRRADGTPLQCTSATVVKSPDGLTASIEPIDQNRTKWRLTLSGNAPTSPGSFKGVVAITTDVPGEEIIEIQFAGVVMGGS